MKIIYLDVETGGLNCEINPLLQLSGLIEIDGKVKEKFDMLIKPFKNSKIDQEALIVQNKTMEYIDKFHLLEDTEAYLKFLKILDKYIDNNYYGMYIINEKAEENKINYEIKRIYKNNEYYEIIIKATNNKDIYTGNFKIKIENNHIQYLPLKFRLNKNDLS